MEQHLPLSHSVLTRNILYYRNIPQKKALHPSIQEVVQSKHILDRTIQIKVLVCDSGCLYDILLDRTSLAHLSAWQDYANSKLYIQQISIPIVAKDSVRILPGNIGIISAALKTGKTTFTSRHTITGKVVAFVRPFDTTLPLRPIEVAFENNKCCIEIHNLSDSIVKFLFASEIAYFDARSKGLVQANSSKHFPIDQYLHDRVTPATLSPKLLAYDEPIHPSEMPRISICTDTITDDTNVPTKDDKYPWLDPDDKRRHMTDAEILQFKLNLDDSLLDEKGKEEFLTKTDEFYDVFSLRDEIGTCPFIEVHLKIPERFRNA